MQKHNILCTDTGISYPWWTAILTGLVKDHPQPMRFYFTKFVSSARWSWMFSLSQLRCFGFRLGRMLYTGPGPCLLQWGSNSLWGEMGSRDCFTWMGNSIQRVPEIIQATSFSLGRQLKKNKATKSPKKKANFRNSIIPGDDLRTLVGIFPMLSECSCLKIGTMW